MTTERSAYLRGWAMTAVAHGMTPQAALEEAERAWQARTLAEEAVMEAMERRSVNGRRVQNRVVACLQCGETLGIFVDGEMAPSVIHVCDEDDDRPAGNRAAS